MKLRTVVMFLMFGWSILGLTVVVKAQEEQQACHYAFDLAIYHKSHGMKYDDSAFHDNIQLRRVYAFGWMNDTNR
jgi:hypothetical protein